MTNTWLRSLRVVLGYVSSYIGWCVVCDKLYPLVGGWAIFLAIAGWFVAGAFYARSRAVELRSRFIRTVYTDFFDEWGPFAWRIVFWPWGIVWDYLLPLLGSWLTAPVESLRAEVETLRDRAWALRREAEGLDGEEARLTREWAASLEAQARAKEELLGRR